MFSIDSYHEGLDVNFDEIRVEDLEIPKDRRYPETRDEGKKALRETTDRIEKEIRYMMGCIYFLKARELRPTPKKRWGGLLKGMRYILFMMKQCQGIRKPTDSFFVDEISKSVLERMHNSESDDFHDDDNDEDALCLL